MFAALKAALGAAWAGDFVAAGAILEAMAAVAERWAAVQLIQAKHAVLLPLRIAALRLERLVRVGWEHLRYRIAR